MEPELSLQSGSGSSPKNDGSATLLCFLEMAVRVVQADPDTV